MNIQLYVAKHKSVSRLQAQVSKIIKILSEKNPKGFLKDSERISFEADMTSICIRYNELAKKLDEILE